MTELAAGRPSFLITVTDDHRDGATGTVVLKTVESRERRYGDKNADREANLQVGRVQASAPTFMLTPTRDA
jgi:hypothetical protein